MNFTLVSTAISVISPISLLLLLGYFLRRKQTINDEFIQISSILSYKLFMPALLFGGDAKANISHTFNIKFLIYFTSATIASFLFAWVLSRYISVRKDRGVFIQSVFRGNNGVVGLAVASSLYQGVGLGLGSVLAGISIILYNVLSVFILSFYNENYRIRYTDLLKAWATNPLIISVIAGMVYNKMGFPMPGFMAQFISYVGAVVLPLALICIGASVSFSTLAHAGKVAVSATILKLIIIPVVFVCIAALLGFNAIEMGLLLVFLSTPTAAITYTIVRSLKGNHQLAANTVALTTLFSMITIPIGIIILNILQTN